MKLHEFQGKEQELKNLIKNNPLNIGGLLDSSHKDMCGVGFINFNEELITIKNTKKESKNKNDFIFVPISMIVGLDRQEIFNLSIPLNKRIGSYILNQQETFAFSVSSYIPKEYKDAEQEEQERNKRYVLKIDSDKKLDTEDYKNLVKDFKGTSTLPNKSNEAKPKAEQEQEEENLQQQP